MAQNFDPNIPDIIQGQVTGLQVIDPATAPPQTGNLVVNPAQDFQIKVSWEVFDWQAPLWLETPPGRSWDVRVYAETMGPGTELQVGRVSVSTADSIACKINGGRVNCHGFEATVPVPANTLKEDGPGESGVYKLVATVFLDRNLGTPGFDMAGYQEGPIIRAENPN